MSPTLCCRNRDLCTSTPPTSAADETKWTCELRYTVRGTLRSTKPVHTTGRRDRPRFTADVMHALIGPLGWRIY